MNFFRSLLTSIYLAVYLIIGGILVIIATNIVSIDQIIQWVKFFYSDANSRMIIGTIGALFVLIGILNAKISSGRAHREKTIAFENPDGQVIISLAAIEDFIRKVVKQIPQVKELKPVVSAGKRGICIKAKASLYSESNIPEITEKVQSMIKTKLAEMLGIEETINVKIHISKLLHRGDKEDASEGNDESRRMPF